MRPCSGRMDPEPQAVPIGQVLRRLLKRKRFYQKRKYRGLVAAWTEVVDEFTAEHTRISGYAEGTVTVDVDSSVLLQELSAFMKHDLLQRMQQEDSGRDVAALRFRLGTPDSEH